MDIGTSGHFKPIKDLSWDESGKYILTASLDETTRIFSRFINSPTFCEISRPQIHGYPINSLSFTSRHQYISASDEKVLRIFEAPISFIETLTKCGINDDDKIRLQAATLPILGLSNKSTSNPQFNSSNKIVEGLLNQKTLWPESMKLYGHNYELVAVDSRNGIVASSNRASNRKSAGIRIWDLDTNLEVFSFYPHNLTVTKLKFSICGKFLASASRDRTFKVSGFVDGKWDVLFSDSFTRVVWDCSWSNDGLFVCACSRDKTLVVYKTGKWERILSVSFESGVNCCDFYIKDGRYFIAVGLELDIIVLEIDVGNCHYKEISKWTGIKGVNVVKWNKDGLFAVGGDDCAMRVYSVFEGGPDL